MKQCSADDCTRPAHSHAAGGLCSTHYYRRVKAQSKAYTYVCAWCAKEFNTYRRARGANPYCTRSCAISYSNRVKAVVAREALKAARVPVLYTGPVQRRQ